MPKTATKIGPKDHGRHMSLADFEFVETVPGYRYELNRGVIVVSDVPDTWHFLQVNAIRKQLDAYHVQQPDRFFAVSSGGECKLLAWQVESERHPDLAVYKTPPPGRGAEVWRTWIPMIAIEVVSPGSEQRDYHDKRADYLEVGVREYWIVDALKEEVLGLRRVKGGWSERFVRPPDLYWTRLLPGFELDCGAVFAAARQVEEG